MVAKQFQDQLIQESLWVHTADTAADYSRLEGDAACDVAIVGAGLLGLSAALELAERGAAVVVLDMAEPGWGGGGRNGGQVNPGLKIDPREIVARFGEDRGRPLVNFAATAADETFATIARYGIDCDASQKGWLQLAHCGKALPGLARRAADWQALGIDVEILSAAQVAERVGSDAYIGGILHPNGGSLHPLKLVNGLARCALARGAAIYRRSPVLRVEHERGRPILVTLQGRVKAERVLLATNAYTGALLPGLQRDILPVSTLQVASEPLEPRHAESILPYGQHASDTHRSLYYFRKDADHRFLIGGRGAYGDRGLAGAYAELRKVAMRIFPVLAGARWQYRWGGVVGVTEDHLPRVAEPAPGVLAAIGFNGRGVALSVALGRRLAGRLLGGAERDLPLPVLPRKPIRLHPLKVAVLPLAAGFYGFLDRLDGGKVV